MIEVNLDRGKFKIQPEKGLKILKKKLMKERVLRELKERQYYVSPGRKAYLQRNHAKHMQEQDS